MAAACRIVGFIIGLTFVAICGVGAPQAEAAELTGSQGAAPIYEVEDVDSLIKAVQNIYESPAEEATILLTADAGNAPQEVGTVREGYPFVGVPGKRVTVKSAPGQDGSAQWYSIFVGADIVGDVVFDNVSAFGRIVFANGYHFETTENCRTGAPGKSDTPNYFGMIFGGGHRAMPEDKEEGTAASSVSDGNASVGNTDLVLGGNVHAVYVFGGGYFSDVAGDTSVRIQGETVSVDYLYGGGVARTLSSDGSDPSGTLVADASKGKVGGSTSVSLSGSVRAKRVFGGGCESSVAGDARVTLDGDDVKVQELYGGGMAQDTAGGTIGGDANVTVRRGEVRAFVAGGANWSREDRSSAAVAGTARAVFGFKNAPDDSVLVGTDYLFDGGSADKYCLGGSLRSTVGNVSLELLEGTTVQGGNLCGCGVSDTVRGTVDVRLCGADTSHVFLLGGGIGSSSDAATDKTIRILNQDAAEAALSISYDAPRESGMVINHGIFAGSALADMAVAGNVLIEMKSGTLEFIQMGNLQTTNAASSCEIAGDAVARIMGGYAYNIVGNEGAIVAGGCRAIYDGCGTESVPQKAGSLCDLDAVEILNSAHVSLRPEFNAYFSANNRNDKLRVPFDTVGKLTVAAGCSLKVTPSLVNLSDAQIDRRVGEVVVEGELHTVAGLHQKEDGGAYSVTSAQLGDVIVASGGRWVSEIAVDVRNVSIEKGGSWSYPSAVSVSAVVRNVLSDKGEVSLGGPFALGKDHAAETGVIDSVVLDCDGGSFSVGPLAQENAATVNGSVRVDGAVMTLESPLHVRGNWDAADAVVRVAESAEGALLCIDGTARGMTGLVVAQFASDGSSSVEVVPASGKSYLTAGESSEGAFFFANADATAPNGKGLFLTQGDQADGQWTVAQGIAVRFDANKGDRMPYWATGSPSSSATFALPAEPTREGYSFKGWNTAADGSGEVFTPDTVLTSSATVYAQWERLAEGEGPTTPGDAEGEGPVNPDIPESSNPSKPSQGSASTGSKPSAGASGVVSAKSPSSAAVSASSSKIQKPAATAIKKLKRAKRGFTVTWKKLSKSKLKQIAGYQIRYSTKKSMKGAKKKTVKITSTAAKKCTLKVTKLKAGKKYYVQVRTYRKVNGKTVYSSWSKAKAVKTKR